MDPPSSSSGAPTDQISQDGGANSTTIETERVQSTPTIGEKGSQTSRIEITANDFLYGIQLGEGSYSRVVHARLKTLDKDYAMKIMEKVHIKNQNKTKAVLMEKNILTRVSHPFIVKLYYSFQDADNIFLCMDLAHGGDLRNVILKYKREKQALGLENGACDIGFVRFYTAEITLGLEYLHAHGIIHRDLKPENVTLSSSGHATLVDFGCAFVVGAEDSGDFVGTAEYVSPEVLGGNDPATKACDLWALGCMVYQMLVGRTPFEAETEFLIYEKIKGHSDGTNSLQYPSSYPVEAKCLTEGLLQSDAAMRLGAGDESGGNGYGTLKGNVFFADTHWSSLSDTVPPYIPDPETFPSADNLHEYADEDWIFGGEAELIGGNVSDFQADDDMGQSRDEMPSHKWQVFLREGEHQIFTGLTTKRKGFSFKRRQLVLTDAPRLIYIDPDSLELKGEIPWTAEFPVICKLVDEFHFDVITTTPKGRAYHLHDKEAGSKMWIELINAMLEKQRDDLQQSQA